MSDLTPDGDRTSNAKVAIRSFLHKNPDGLSQPELDMLRAWAVDCADPPNAARLSQLIRGLSFSG